jgi:hypothetical protein
LISASSRQRGDPPKLTFTRDGSSTLRVAERATMASLTSLASGKQSNGSSRPTPASSEQTTLRSVWPQADRADRP